MASARAANGRRNPTLGQTLAEYQLEQDALVAEIGARIRSITGAKKDVAMKVASAYAVEFDRLTTANERDLLALGLTAPQASKLLDALTLLRLLERTCSVVKLQTPRDVAGFIRGFLRGATQESFVVVLLDTRLRVMHALEVAKGSRDKVEVDRSAVFREAIRLGANAIVIAHNHPSGDPRPSKADIDMTIELGRAAFIIGIQLLDHVVIGRNTEWSVREHWDPARIGQEWPG